MLTVMPLLSSQIGDMPNNTSPLRNSCSIFERCPESAFGMEASVTSHGSHNTFHSLDV